MKIFYKTRAEIAKLREANLIVSDILDLLEDKCRPGVSTAELNEIADTALKKTGALSAFLGYAEPPYPAVLCTSINEVVVHGIPRREQVLKDGDIIGIDFGAFKHGFCGDSARTVMVGKVQEEVRRLVEATRRSLDLAIEKCVPGSRLQDVGWAVQSYVEPLGYSVVRKFVGHGIGRAMHEDPQVPNYGEPHKGIKLKPGLVLAIEPMVNAGTAEVDLLEDGWTAVTKDRRPSAHFEHSVAVTDEGPMVLSPEVDDVRLGAEHFLLAPAGNPLYRRLSCRPLLGERSSTAMKVRTSVKKICEKCKIVRRRGIVRVICDNSRHKQRQG